MSTHTTTHDARPGWLRSTDPFDWRLTPGRIAGLYLVLGVVALYFSDVVLVMVVESPALLSQLQALKGFVEVLATAGLIYVLTAKSHDQLHAKNETLARLQRELSVLHRVFRHNLRNSLTVIMGTVEEFERRRPGTDEDPAIRRCRMEIRRIMGYIEHADTIYDTTGNGDGRLELDLADVVRHVTAELELESLHVDVDRRLPASARVAADPQIEDAVAEALRNTLRHAGESLSRIEVGIERVDGEVVLEVADDGPGLPSSEIDVLHQDEETALSHGTGMGLWMMNWIAERSGGEMRIDTGPAAGTSVRFRLPAA